MGLSRRRFIAGTAAVAAASVAAPHVHAQKRGGTLRFVPHADLKILDPIWTTAYITRNHGYMIYDTLFGSDEKNQVKPQMVESWTVSPDNRLWTFKLRKGLEFHEGKPVTGEDVAASIARWGKRDAMGSALMTFVQRMDTPAPDTFRIFLGEACGFVLEALGKPSSNVPFIMPKRIAETDAFTEPYRQHRPMVERSIAWLVQGGNRKVRYRGIAKNDLWLHHRLAGLNLRRLLRLGLQQQHGAWALA